MTASGDSSTARLRTDPESSSLPRRRRRTLCFSLLLIIIFILFITILILALTVFRVKDPTTHVTSVDVAGISPGVTFPISSFKLNVTLNLSILVHNPNAASFTHALGRTQLFYRGNPVGSAEVEPGRIPSRGSADVEAVLTVEADQFAAQVGTLLSDVLAGAVGLDASTRIPGRVKILGLFTHHAVAYSQCHVVIGFPDLKLKEQTCTNNAKL